MVHEHVVQSRCEFVNVLVRILSNLSVAGMTTDTARECTPITRQKASGTLVEGKGRG